MALNVPDYLTLHKNDADFTTNNIMKFNIPQHYYTNTRGDVCYVSLVSCATRFQNPNTTPNIFSYQVNLHSLGQNIASSGNRQNCLGILQKNLTTSHIYDASEKIQLLIPARPSTIELSISCLTDNNAATAYDTIVLPDSAVFVLKFEYLDSKKETVEYVKSQYTKL
jgi:hypothetical protein